jgi:protein subunit release factor A
MEGDAEVVAEAEAALAALVREAAAKELEALLDGEADGNDTFLEINAGAGGTESCDWAAMLARMYVRWAEKKRLRGRAAIRERRRRGGDQVGRLQDFGPQRLWLAEIGKRRAPAGADLAL